MIRELFKQDEKTRKDYLFFAGLIMFAPYVMIGSIFLLLGFGWWAALPFSLAIICFYYSWVKAPTHKEPL